MESDLFYIEPVEKYTNEDLDWNNANSRSSLEMADDSSRPKIVRKVSDLEQYQKIILGFPIWWYKNPSIINTFLDENDLTGKDIYVFARQVVQVLIVV